MARRGMNKGSKARRVEREREGWREGERERERESTISVERERERQLSHHGQQAKRPELLANAGATRVERQAARIASQEDSSLKREPKGGPNIRHSTFGL
eukprot:7158952-Alexandrium_andersonii.AAC.1